MLDAGDVVERSACLIHGEDSAVTTSWTSSIDVDTCSSGSQNGPCFTGYVSCQRFGTDGSSSASLRSLSTPRVSFQRPP